jgi:hypothetical protein
LPEIVKVVAVPGLRYNELPVQTYSVPPLTLVTTGADQPGGVPAAWFTTTDETVSTTVRFSIVAAPTFATTIVYVTGAPTTPPPLTCFVTVKSMTGAGNTNPDDGLVLTALSPQYPDPTAYAVFDTAVSTHTVPTTPVIVNVNA